MENPYHKTWKLRAVIRAAYCFAARFDHLVDKTERLPIHQLAYQIQNSYELNAILKQAQRRIASGKTIKLP